MTGMDAEAILELAQALSIDAKLELTCVDKDVPIDPLTIVKIEHIICWNPIPSSGWPKKHVGNIIMEKVTEWKEFHHALSAIAFLLAEDRGRSKCGRNNPTEVY